MPICEDHLSELRLGLPDASGSHGRPLAWNSSFEKSSHEIEHMEEVTEYIEFRNANPIPDVMTILSGIGSPREMKHTDEKWHTENFMWGNARTRRRDFWSKPNEENWTKAQLDAVQRLIGCFSCPQQCGALVSSESVGGQRYMMKCFGKLTYSMAAYVDDLRFNFRILQRATEYGVDSFSTPQILAFAVELYEAAILTDKDFEGCPSDKEGRFFWLLDRVARREGIGDVLADGVYYAARKIGNGAEKFDHNTIKKHEQLPVKLGVGSDLFSHVFYQREDKHYPN